MGHADMASYIGSPAFAISGWAALGHLITLDDDALGGWSNPEKDLSMWHHSLLGLGVKIAVFAFVGIAVYM